MSRLIALDSGVIGLLCSSPTLPGVALCHTWFHGLGPTGIIFLTPDITLYEVRRELIRIKATKKLLRLENLLRIAKIIEVTSEAWLKAAEFWALVRSAGKPTADPQALDGDAILAGVAATIGSPVDQVTIATTNVGHLSRFPGVDARRWETIP